MGYVVRRIPTHRRGQASEVDVDNLVQLVMRRCRGCEPPERYPQVAKQFLTAVPGKFGDDVQQSVLAAIQAKVDRMKPPPRPRSSGTNGSVVCSACGQRLYDHPADKKYPWLTVLCDGRKARVW